ncbi:hypothetical protein [Paenibacillus sp. 1P03SA]
MQVIFHKPTDPYVIRKTFAAVGQICKNKYMDKLAQESQKQAVNK